jgi:hypothetical protein
MSRSPKVLLLVLLTACSVGEVPDGTTTPDAKTGGDGGGGTGGGQTFNTMIKPLVDGRCTSCHAGGTAPNLSSFMMLEPKYKMKPGASNILVTEGNLTSGQHHGIPYFNATEQTTVKNWIDSLP